MTKTLEPLPYFKWLWRDWRANRHVQRLHYVAKGLYRELLDEQWCEGFIPPDIETLADICNCPVDVMQEHWTSLQDLFETQEDGRLVNRKLEQQRTAEDSIRAAKARGGQKSALAKLNKINKSSRGAEDLLDSSSRPEAESHIAEQSRAETEQSISEQEADFDEGEVDMSKISKEIQLACGGRSKVYPQQDEQLRALEVEHSRSAVVTDFRTFLQENEGDDFRYGPVSAYLNIASDRLSSDTTQAVASLKDPEVVSLARELSYLSGGQISLLDKQRIRLAEVLKEFSAAEITSAFSAWYADQDTSDPKNVSFLAGKFVQIVDGLAYAARKKKQESEQVRIARDATARKLQEEAEAERQAAAQKEKEADFDPFSSE